MEAATFVDPVELTRRVQSLRSSGTPEAVEEAARLEREAEAARLRQLRVQDNLTPIEQEELERLEEADLSEKPTPEVGGSELVERIEELEEIVHDVRQRLDTLGERIEALEPDPIDATDGAVKYAKEHDVNLSLVQGSGENGRIIKSDVEKVVSD